MPAADRFASFRACLIACGVVLAFSLVAVALLLGPFMSQTDGEAIARAKRVPVAGQRGLTYGELIYRYEQSCGVDGTWAASGLEAEPNGARWDVWWSMETPSLIEVHFWVPRLGWGAQTWEPSEAAQEMIRETRGEEAVDSYIRATRRPAAGPVSGLEAERCGEFLPGTAGS